MRFWGAVALRCVKSEELTPLEWMTANEWGSEPALSARMRLWYVRLRGAVRAVSRPSDDRLE